MKIRTLAFAATAALGAAAATPAHATWWTTHTHYCNCGHSGGSKSCGGTSTSSSTTSGGTTTSSGGTTTSSGGTSVPEPGMLGMMALGLLGVGFARSRKTKPRP